MSRGRSLLENLPKTMRAAIVLACIAGLLAPSLAAGTRRRRAGHRSHPAPRRKGPAQRPHPRRHAKRAARNPSRGSRGSVDEHVHLRRGDTLGTILTARGLSVTEASPWLTAAADVFDLKALHPHRGLTLRFDRATRALEAVRYEIDDRTLLVLEDTPDGIAARREELPYFIEVKGVAGRIGRGLREDAVEAGVPEPVVTQLADVFGWEVDVENGLRPGDEFRVLYENLWQAGLGRAGTGKVLGAQIMADGKPTTAVYFEDHDGRGAYYRPSGDALSRSILRYPLEFTEITSEFSLLRRHPILHVDRPHLGVDLAAPRGTPVRAVASGHVSYSGWVHGLGRCVRIDHAEALTSAYGHLARIASGVKIGASVEQGQVIGYVGASGLATGPHLHYALERGGEYVDPMRLSASAESSVPPAERRAFDRVQSEVTRQLVALPATARLTTVSVSTAAYPSAAYRSE